VDGALVNQMNRTPDGQFQTYAVESGSYAREHFFGADPRLLKMVEHLSDDAISKLPRGGHDYRKVYGAFKAATEHSGQPTVILAQTIKGWTIDALEGRNATHQMKKLTKDDLKKFRDRLFLPIDDKAIDESEVAPFYHPGQDDEEIQYMLERRRQLGGAVPERTVKGVPLKLPGDPVYAELKGGSGKQQIASTMAFVRLLRDLMRDDELGNRIVPIAPDEFRTFGMDSMFPTAKVYSPHGQTYESVDRKLLLAYKEAKAGQLLHEGISELGAMGSAIAAGTSYATHGEPMIPFYIFYSMFGFQRTGDWMYAMADQLGRGFLIGATAGRTTLTGEGLQHADGHSPLIARTNPAVVHYDPAWGFEISHIVRRGLERMYGSTDEYPHGEDVIFYMTVYNEPVVQPAEPEDLDVDGLLKGAYVSSPAPTLSEDAPQAQVLASGVALPWALEAQTMLAERYDVAAEVWSVTSWNELARDGSEVETWNLNHPGDDPRTPYITTALSDAGGPTIAVSDYMRAVPDQIARWVPTTWQSLGADGFGFADTRAAARRYFQVDTASIVVATLETLAAQGQVKRETATQAYHDLQIDDPTAVADVPQEGADA
ncbi:MAG: transketolase-like TK C-terminal-containing protein, partial [Nocardioidaceae bacterium]